MNRRFDLLVLGGGLTGLALAAAVGGAGGRVALIERRRVEATLTPTFDGRVTAVASGSQRFLAAIGAWEELEATSQPIQDIVVRERFSPLEVHYDHRELDGGPLGWIVENRRLRSALAANAARGDIELMEEAEVVAIERDAVTTTLALADGRRVRGALLAVAEGKASPTRARLGIGARRRPYGQTGLVCTLAHERPHRGFAVERFFPDGPFARLPMTGERSSIVWALRDELSRDVGRLDDAAFLGEVGERCGDELGRLALEGPRWTYPLELVVADSYVADRAALVGDAARSIHPIAGQGWNLAVRDVAALTEIVVDRLRLGLDPGDRAALERYAGWRRFDGLALVAVTDGLNRLFANGSSILRLLREGGLGVVERTGPLKRLFMRHAAGLLGELPRTMRGEAL